LINVAQQDQFDAACRDVRDRATKLRDAPPPGCQIVVAKDLAVHDALTARLQDELSRGLIWTCCARSYSPQLMYWIPRSQVMVCERHWRNVQLCGCHDECDACRLPCDNGEFGWLFLGPFVVNVALCVSCHERAGGSPAGG
jgi:hypothetical protein